MRAALFLLLFPAVAATGNEGAASGEPEEARSRIGRMGDPTGINPETFEFSPAEKLIWLSDHLSNIEQPGLLRYSYKKEGSLEEGFEDEVKLNVHQLHEDGTRSVHLEYLTGVNRQKLPYTENSRHVRGNPIMGMYMQSSVHEMERLTEGGWRHFQRLIKQAFADTEETRDVDISYAGESVPAQRITIWPFRDDPKRVRYETLADRRYEFTFSNTVPGHLYSITSVVPDAEGGDTPLLTETLMFDSLQTE